MSLINGTFFLVLLLIFEVVPVQIGLQEGEELNKNVVQESQLNDCLSVKKGAEVGVCFGKELLTNLNQYDEAESFSLATGITFVRDEKSPRDFGHFLDKDPMDFRSIMEDASDLISKRSLHWDMSKVYPGLVMRIGPTLANGVLEFVVDPRIKDRTYQSHSEITTGRLLARNVLVPFLLGIKFHISTLLPLLLGLVLMASKKAFLLAKIALLAITVFSSSSGYGGQYFSGLGTPSLSSYTTSHENLGHYHSHHGTGGPLTSCRCTLTDPSLNPYGKNIILKVTKIRHYHRPSHYDDHYYKEKSAETTASPITPDELKDRLERLFITKKVIEDPRDEAKIRNARNFAWTPINVG